jgi:hypothetical protein
MTETFFNEQMSRLIGLRFVPSDMVTHWEALHDLPEDVLTNAVSLAGRTRVDFPTPHQLRQDADMGRTVTVAHEPDRAVTLDQPFTVTIPQTQSSVHITREWTYYCEYCSDGGWRSLWCGDPTQKKPWHLDCACNIPRTHPPHEWVEQCVCYSSNPALLRKRVAQQHYAVRDTPKTRH